MLSLINLNMKVLFTILTLLSAPLGCSKAQIAKSGSLLKATSLIITPVEGADQSVDPRAAFKPIVFVVKDNTQKPIPNAKIELKIMDVTGLASVTPELIGQGFLANKKYLNPENGLLLVAH